MCTTKELRDFDSLFQLIDYFKDEETCTNYLATIRWNGNPTCVYCDHEKVYELNVKGRGKRWKCSKCRKQFSVRVGTIFEESKLPLRKWFVAIYLVTAHKKGISSHQLARDLKITQKASWFVLHRIRQAFAPEPEEFTGTVEVDETWVGGKEKNKHKLKRTKGTQGRSTKTKTPVLGVLQRDGKVFAVPVKNTTTKVLKAKLRNRISQDAKVYTDEYRPYGLIFYKQDHEFVCHSADEFVRGDVHTNSIEAFWAIFKRGLHGIYHKVSNKHLDKYVNEFTFRFNNRNLTDGSRFDVLLANSAGKLTYDQLKK